MRDSRSIDCVPLNKQLKQITISLTRYAVQRIRLDSKPFGAILNIISSARFISITVRVIPSAKD